MDTLPGLFDALQRQDADFEREVVAIDSGSTDGTTAFLAPRVDRLLTIPAASFNHGETRNRAIAETRGAFVILLSQDAEPANAEWMRILIAPLERSARVAGTYARQTPREDAPAIAVHYLSRWDGASATPRISSLESPAALQRMTPVERMRACAFDNVCSCIRRSVWQRLPFTPTTIAEDLEWARDVLLAGHVIEYVPQAAVRHSHDRSAWYEFERTRLLHQRLYDLFGVRTIPSLSSLGRAILSSTRLHVQCRRSSSAASSESLGRALALALAWPAGQFVGGLAGRVGVSFSPSRHV